VRLGPRSSRPLVGLAAASVALLAGPSVASAHAINTRYEAPLPLIAYVAGAALAVAMSFVFVSLREQRSPTVTETGQPRTVHPLLRWTLRAVGLLGWAWIMAQAFLGGNDPAADIGQIVLWIYGWIGLALLSALVGPIWAWLDPFSTMHLLLVGAGRRLGLLSTPAEDEVGDENGADVDDGNLGRLGRWPAVVGFAVVVWLELVAFVTGGRTLALLLLAYTLITLAGMAWFGRRAWRRHAEIFSVWFGLLGRLAPYRLEGEAEENRVVRRPFASGLFAEPWTRAELALLTLGTASIIFDGLSQTKLYFDLIGRIDVLPSAVINTIALGAWFALLLGLVFGVARRIGVNALGAGLLPVAIGYLVAHYFVTLVFDGQRIIMAVNDPLVRGDSLLPYPLSDMSQPWAFLPASIIWSIQLGAVVGGHIVGAWAGHAALTGGRQGARLASQLPLAALMVTFTSVTLWSLGQQVVVEQPQPAGQQGGPPIVVMADGPPAAGG
jgi:hypothetical protein